MYVKTNWVDNTTPINENNLNKIESGIKNNDINIGEENYDNTKTYEVGDIVRYNEKIYKCITAITTAENFDISKWEQTNIVEIVQSEKSKIYELIEAISTPIVGEGENITLNDTAEKRFENFDIEGNSEQETRSGKNKLKFSGLTSRTINGLTITNNKDGSITLNGTTTDTVSMTLSNNMYNLVAGKYYLSRNSIGTVSGTFTNILYGKNETAVNIGGLKSEGMIITATTDYQEYYLWLYVASGITFTNYTMKPQLETGTVKTDWELYGASPSPDYPSEVKSCGDNINIFDGEVEEGNINASTGQNTGTTSAWRSKNYLNVKDTSVSISVKDLTFSGTVGRLYFYKSDNTYISNILINSLPFTATLPNETAKVRFFILNSAADINAKIKLEKGSTVTPYTPYGQGCINEVICNKNLFDKESVLTGTAIQRNTGNILTTSAYSTYSTSDYCKVKSSTTYFLGIAYSSTNFGVVYYDKDKNYISGEKLNNYFTTPSNCEYVRFTWITADYNISTIQLEEGTTATDYVEHQSQTYTIPTQQPMRAIGDVKDKFILKENGKWYERHNIARLVLKGNGFWSYNAGVGFHSSSLQGIVKNGSEALSNKYKYTPLTWQGNYTFSINSTGLIAISDNTYSTVDDWKAHLAEQYANGTPVYVDYVLATPTDIECTSQQTEILNHMYIKAKSYKGVTHIYSNDEVSPNCYVEAVKDLTTLIQ